MWRNKTASGQKRNSKYLRQRYIVISLLLFAVIGFLAVPSFRRLVSGTAMLFTQKSAQTLAGAISRAAFPAGSSVIYTVFQGLLLPHLPQLTVIGNTLAFGPLKGLLVSLAGTLAAGSACFWLSRVLLRDLIFRLEPKALGTGAEKYGFIFFAGLRLILWGGFIPLCYLAGLSAMRFRQFLISAVLSQIPVLLVYTLCCDAYRTSPPQGALWVMRIAGVCLVLCGALITERKNKSAGEGI